ncbi:unnamed protein product [Mycena citricolor]|uniref:Integrase catalytic domain-containing protein n=1 Tax=Mycena citricolor TaxID=2018698 RepID=A0AAD2H1P3_9AGAR|nr:unnamed protein product [Mycena citricolor]
MGASIAFLPKKVSSHTTMTHALPLFLPPPDGHVWSTNAVEAAQQLSLGYEHALAVLNRETDINQVRYHLKHVASNLVPILKAFEHHAVEEGIPMDWICSAAQAVGKLMKALCVVCDQMAQEDHVQVLHAVPVETVYTGGRGRPRKIINAALLHEAMSNQRKISISKLARTLRVSRPTLLKQLRDLGISYKFSELSRDQLDELVRHFKSAKPDSGVRYLDGHLRQRGLRIQKHRVRSAVHRVDGFGRLLRARRIVKRQEYRVSRPHALWHVDGHHKLILWGIVIHGFVDGYSRTVTALRASTNNQASTVLRVLLDAVGKYGILPSRIRGDRGGENKKVSVYMILKRGLGRASFMWGSSTHNTRIERLWVEVGSQFVRRWRAFFYRLEALHSLDRKDKRHLWLLHHLFLDQINADCENFCQEWNCHPISGEGHDQTPNDLCLLGQLEHGFYDPNEYAHVHPSVLERHYGVVGNPFNRENGQTGAGQLGDEDVPSPDPGDCGSASSAESECGSIFGSDDGELRRQIETAHEKNFHHDPVSVPKHAAPFDDDKTMELFFTALAAAEDRSLVPAGFGLYPEEWVGGEYPTHEILKSGRHGGKRLQVALPVSIWKPRAEIWARGLAILNEITYMFE